MMVSGRHRGFWVFRRVSSNRPQRELSNILSNMECKNTCMKLRCEAHIKQCQQHPDKLSLSPWERLEWSVYSAGRILTNLHVVSIDQHVDTASHTIVVNLTGRNGSSNDNGTTYKQLRASFPFTHTHTHTHTHTRTHTHTHTHAHTHTRTHTVG